MRILLLLNFTCLQYKHLFFAELYKHNIFSLDSPIILKTVWKESSWEKHGKGSHEHPQYS